MSLLPQFLNQINTFVRIQDGDQLKAWLQVEPSAPQQYHNLARELRSQFSRNASGSVAALEKAVERGLPEDDDVPEGQATAWPGLVTFMRDYLAFWRDVEYSDLVGAHSRLCALVNSCSTAFAHPTYGGMLLKTSMSLCESLSRLTMLLNRRPDLTAGRGAGGDEEGRKSVAETSAEIIQKIFTTCLTDRSSARFSRPEGKKIGVYMFANLVLKLLFACRKTHLARQIFTNINTNSPPLSFYPASQRVTFLYYLGRFNLSNNHFIRAANCLQEAYLQTPPSLTSHRTLILTYLIPSNLLLGRLPSTQLLQRPEARVVLAPIFNPLAAAIRTGNFILFQHTLSTYESWLLDRGLLLVLTHRLRPLLWRSLSRRIFLLTYVAPADADPSSRRAAVLDLAHLHIAATYIQHRLEGWVPGGPTRVAPPHINSIFLKAVSNNVGPNDSSSTLVPPPGGPKKLRPNEGLVWGNSAVTAADVEVNVMALVQQGLMHGYIAHGMGKFAIMGAKQKGPVAAGWPAVWSAIRERRYEEEIDVDEVPGWVRG